MMKYFLMIMTIMMLYSCDKEKISIEDDDYLIFGHYYGLCLGDQCVQTYKLTETLLYKDKKGQYGATDFDFKPLPDDKFQIVKNLVDSIPSQLLSSDEEIFGCPDCGDQGGLYIEVSDKGKVHSWRIDQWKKNVPQYLHDFMDGLNRTIAKINN